MRDLVAAIVLGFVGIKGLVWVCGDTALAISSTYWTSGEAVIDRSWLDKTFGRTCNPCYSLETEYHFSVRGERYTGNRFEIPSRRSGGDEDYYRRKLAPYNPGSVVKILYDPKNPRLSVVTQPHINYFFIAMIGSLSLLFCAIAVWRLYAFVCNLLKPQSRSPGT